MKGSFVLGVFAIALIILPSCTKNNEINQEPNLDQSQHEHTNLRVSDAHNAVAELFSLALHDDKFADELYEMVSQKRDGDNEILLDEVLSNNDLRSTNTLYSCLDRCFRSLNKLRSTDFDISKYKDLKSFTNDLLAVDPLLQISVFSSNNKKVDLKDDNVLILSLPEDIDDQQEITLIARDKNGKEYLVKSTEEPDVPVVIIGQNERLVAVNKNQELSESLKNAKLYHKGSVYDYYLRPDLLIDIDYISSILTGITEDKDVPKCDREKHPQYREYIEKARFTSQKALRRFEPWILGAPEIKYTIIPIKKLDARIAGECMSNGWKNGATRYLNIRLFRWDRSVFGDYYLVYWTEVDGGSLRKIEVKFLDLYIKIEKGWADDQIGGSYVNYKDNAINGERYDIGDLFQFWVKIEK